MEILIQNNRDYDFVYNFAALLQGLLYAVMKR